jgi:hypothetical protein
LRGKRLEQALVPQNFDAAFQAFVPGQDAPALFGGNGAEQHIDRSTLDAPASASIEQARCLLVMRRCDGLVRKGLEGAPQLFKLSGILDAGENFLPDGADHGYATVLDRFPERCQQELIVAAQVRPVSAPEQEGPDACIDQELQRST